MGWFDVHAHLTDRRLAAIEDAVIARARAAGLTTIISNGLNPLDNARVAAVAARHPDLVRPAFGLYPVDAVLGLMVDAEVPYHRDDAPIPDPDEAVQWVEDHIDDCVAVGEIGLDHYWVPEAFWAAQDTIFRRLVTLAMAADKPIIIHTRKAERRAFEIVEELGAKRVDWHCFGSKVKLARRIAEAGHWLSIPANARRSESFTRMIETLPRDRILLETDCPYLPPVRDTLNEPGNVPGTAVYMAERWQAPIEEVKAQLEDNFEALFGFAP